MKKTFLVLLFCGILGVDLSVPPDGVIDSFYVDPGYLNRNLIMNGVNLGWLAIAPPIPQPEFIPTSGGIEIRLFGSDSVYQHYRVGVRTRRSGSNSSVMSIRTCISPYEQMQELMKRIFRNYLLHVISYADMVLLPVTIALSARWNSL